MSTSLLYHTWGIRGYTYIHTRYEKGYTIFRVEQEEPSLRSSCCGSRKVNKRGATKRTFKTTPVGNRPVLIELPVQRVECMECGVVRQVNVQFSKSSLRGDTIIDGLVFRLFDGTGSALEVSRRNDAGIVSRRKD